MSIVCVSTIIHLFKLVIYAAYQKDLITQRRRIEILNSVRYSLCTQLFIFYNVNCKRIPHTFIKRCRNINNLLYAKRPWLHKHRTHVHTPLALQSHNKSRYNISQGDAPDQSSNWSNLLLYMTYPFYFGNF